MSFNSGVLFNRSAFNVGVVVSKSGGVTPTPEWNQWKFNLTPFNRPSGIAPIVVPIVPIIGGEPGITSFPIVVFDENMIYVGLVDDYTFVQWIRNWYSSDTWQLKINRYKNSANMFVRNGYIGFKGRAGYYYGWIEQFEIELTEEGKVSEEWTISGRGVEGTLNTRLALAGTGSATGYDIQTGTAEAAMRHYVDFNCINAVDNVGDPAPNRTIPGLSLELTNGGRGGTVKYQARFQYIDEICDAICQASDPNISYKFVHNTGKLFVFTIREGRDKSSITLSTSWGNAAGHRYLQSLLNSRNILYVAGQDVAAARAIKIVYEGSEPTGIDRREALIDARDLETDAELAIRGAERLNELAEEITLDVVYFDSGSFVYGDHFDIGDVITVVYEGVATVISRIVSVTEEVSYDGQRITLEIGKTYPDMKSIVKTMRKAYDAEVRR